MTEDWNDERIRRYGMRDNLNPSGLSIRTAVLPLTRAVSAQGWSFSL
jgi:hypothetical protein